MLRRLAYAIVMIPVGAVLVAWSVANRGPVVVSFDPFDPASPAFAVTMPLYLVGFAILIAGVILGGFAAWLRQRRWRRAHARRAAEIGILRMELERTKRQAAARDGRALVRAAGSLFRKSPAA